MITEANIRESAMADSVYELQGAAYGVEAERVGVADFPPLRQSLDEVRRSPDCFLVWIEEGSIRGCLSYEVTPPLVTITRLVVRPACFRRGIASALLRDLESRLAPGSLICGFTADLNEPAVRTYEKN